MRNQKRLLTFLLILGLVFTGILIASDTVYAGQTISMRQAERLALKKVKKAAVTEVDKDYEKGILIYNVHLWKGTKEYELTYRASDGVLLSYSWEEIRINMTSRRKIMSGSTCRKLARKEVPNAAVTGIAKKYDGGIYRYKVKLQKGDKKFSLEYHARTQKLLKYNWQLKTFKGTDKYHYIGWKKARKIALARVPEAEVLRVELNKAQGVPVYEVKLVKDGYEYEIMIHAATGKVMKMYQHSISSGNSQKA